MIYNHKNLYVHRRIIKIFIGAFNQLDNNYLQFYSSFSERFAAKFRLAKMQLAFGERLSCYGPLSHAEIIVSSRARVYVTSFVFHNRARLGQEKCAVTPLCEKCVAHMQAVVERVYTYMYTAPPTRISASAVRAY